MLARIALFFGFAFGLAGQTLISTPAAISGSNATVAIGSSGSARWIIINAPTANNALVRCGDSATTADRGITIDKGTSLTLPVLPDRQPGYQLSKIFCYVASGDKLNIMWAR